MLEKELSFADLSISLSELYEAMGYADAVPDEAVEKEVRGVLGRVEAVTSPRFCFFISGGELDESKDSLSVGDTCFSIGKNNHPAAAWFGILRFLCRDCRNRF